MSGKPIPTQPVDDYVSTLQQEFYKSITAQSELMDKVSANLFTLELAIPGLYATVLKLIRGENATVSVNAFFFISFGCWLLALALTLTGMIPRKYKVNPDLIKQDPKKMSEEIGIQDFFERSARYKRGFIIASSILFFAGIVSAIFMMG